MIPVGTECYIPVTINHALISDARAHFPYQIDISGRLISEPSFKSFINSADNVAVYDPVGDVTLLRHVTLDLSSNLLLISFDFPTSTSENKIVWICVGPTLSYTNSNDVFLNSNYERYYGFDELSGTVAEDKASSDDMTLASPAALGYDALFGKGMQHNLQGTGSFGTVPNCLVGSYNFSMEFIWKFHRDLVYTIPQFLHAFYGGDPSRSIFQYYYSVDDTMRLALYWPSTRIHAIRSMSGQSEDEFIHVLVVWDGTQASTTDRIRIYINGVAGSLSWDNLGSVTYTYPSINIGGTGRLYGGGGYNGNFKPFEELGLMGVSESINYAVTRTNMFLNSSSFFSLGLTVYIDEIEGPEYNTPINTRLDLSYSDLDDVDVVVIPFQNLPSFVEEIELDGVPVKLNLTWNSFDECWNLDILNTSDGPIISGVKLTIGYDLVSRYRVAGLPPGKLMVIDPTFKFDDIGYDDFVNKRGLQLVYVGVGS
jgi:hypothetical protein